VQTAPLITHRFAIDQGLTAYDVILKSREPYIGVLLTYPEAEKAADGKPGKFFLQPAGQTTEAMSRLAVGLIGGGLFTKNILLPAMKKVPGIKPAGAATTTGVTAHHLAKKFGFAYATTDYREVLADPAIGSVLITTRHNSHAPLVLEALAAGKHVFVEKPLCLAEEELERIIQAHDGSRLLMVGFNRRFAPLARKVKAALAGRTTPLMMTYRVNAGFIPDDHWVHDPEVGGGRLLSEVCHFIDFFHYMTGSEAVQVSVTPIAGEPGKYRHDDNICLTLTFRDGSVGTILYTAKGSKTFSRERFEVFWEDSVGVIEDFRRGFVVQTGRSRTFRKFSMDMGYRAELEAFFTDSWDEAGIKDFFRSQAQASLATLKAAASLRAGRPATINFLGSPPLIEVATG
jgi:predicted dehydrogenase